MRTKDFFFIVEFHGNFSRAQFKAVVHATEAGLEMTDSALPIPRMRGQENRECRRVRFALAEDLPLWARFARDSKTGKRRHELSWATVFLFPNPIDGWFGQIHAIFTSLELLVVFLFLMLNMICGCDRYSVGVTCILSFMLAGAFFRTLSGALIDPQAWLVVAIVKGI